MSAHKCTAASVAALDTLRLDCDPSLIRDMWKAESETELRGIWAGADAVIGQFYRKPDLWTIKRACIDKAGGYHGVEYLGNTTRSRPWPLEVYYCNAGDTYSPTIVFIGPRLVVTDWGTLIERKSVRHPNDRGYRGDY